MLSKQSFRRQAYWKGDFGHHLQCEELRALGRICPGSILRTIPSVIDLLCPTSTAASAFSSASGIILLC